MGKRKEALQRMFDEKEEKKKKVVHKKVKTDVHDLIDNFQHKNTQIYIKNIFKDQFEQETFDKLFSEPFPFNYWLYLKRDGKWEFEYPYVSFEDAQYDARVYVPYNEYVIAKATGPDDGNNNNMEQETTTTNDNSPEKVQLPNVTLVRQQRQAERFDIRRYPDLKDFILQVEKLLEEIEDNDNNFTNNNLTSSLTSSISISAEEN